jgi:hypothetical protein
MRLTIQMESEMYEVFNSFIDNDTWDSCHPLDEQRFYQALDQVVRKGQFSPEEMGNYLADRRGVARDDEHFGPAIRHYVAGAWAVRQYLSATGTM